MKDRAPVYFDTLSESKFQPLAYHSKVCRFNFVTSRNPTVTSVRENLVITGFETVSFRNKQDDSSRVFFAVFRDNRFQEVS